MDKAGGLNPLSGDKELEELEKKLADAADGDKEAIQKEIDEYKKKKEEDGGMLGGISSFGGGLMDKAGGLNPMGGDKELEELEKKLADAADGDKEAIQKEIDEYKAKKEEGGMFGGISSMGGGLMDGMKDMAG